VPDHADPRIRLSIVGVVVVSLFASLFARLWYLQVINRSEFQVQASAIHLRVIHEEGTRGRILDRNGKVLVDNRVSLVVYLDHLELKNVKEVTLKKVFVRLAETLTSFGVRTKAPEIQRLFNDKRYGPQELVPIASDVSQALELYLAEHHDEFPGVVVKRRTVRTYPYGKLAAHLVGYVGQISEKELAARQEPSDGEEASATSTSTTSASTSSSTSSGSGTQRSNEVAKPYQPGDQIGKAGVEATFEQYLRGVPGDRTIQVDARGDYLTTTKETASRPGEDVWLSIDLDLQSYAEQLLSQTLSGVRGTVDKDGKVHNAPQGSVVITDPATGQLLAMASFPSYDPAELVNGISTDLWERLNDKASGQPLFNWALQGTYAPGSTFKLFTAAGALESGFLHPGNDSYYDRGSYKVGGCKSGKCEFRNSGGAKYGAVNVSKALTVSSDVFFYWLGDQLWQQRGTFGDTPIQDAATSFGLGEKTGVALPGEAKGRVPTPAWLEAVHNANPKAFPRGQWRAGDNLNTAVGQGDVLVTPLQLANAYATFANGGTHYVPQIALKVTRPKDVGHPVNQAGNAVVVREFASEANGTVELTPEARAQIYSGLEGVVMSGSGTAHSAYTAHPPSWPAAGKTGTAQVNGKADTSVFVGWGPADIGSVPRYAISSIIPESGFGGDVSAPLVMSIMQAISNGTVPQVLSDSDRAAGLEVLAGALGVDSGGTATSAPPQPTVPPSAAPGVAVTPAASGNEGVEAPTTTAPKKAGP